MRIFLAVLVLISSCQSLAKADDIRDFQIEGMSIGDSLLDYFNEDEIKLQFPYRKDTFGHVVLNKGSYQTFDNMQFHLKKDDKEYKIHALEGLILFYDNIKECYPKKKEIVNDLKHLFSNSEIENIKSNHYLDKTGKSKVDETIFWIDTGETIRIGCYDWSEEFDYGDKLTVAILSKEITKFFIDEY